MARLLEPDFPGRDAFRAQATGALVRLIESYDDNYGSIEFVTLPGEPSSFHTGMFVEARAFDIDGVPIDYLLHAREGYLDQLEVVRADGKPMQRNPDAWELDVWVRGSSSAGT